MLPAPYTWSLTAVAIGVAVAMLWAFKRYSDQARIQVAKRKIRAHLLAFRLYGDEPLMMFRSQGQLLVWNMRYLALMLKPTAVTIIPLAFLLFHLDAVYGRRALNAGESTVVTAQLSGASGEMRTLSLEGNGVAVETPALRFPEEGRVCWRVRASQRGSGSVQLVLSSGALTKSIQAGRPALYVSARRVSSVVSWLCYPAEARLADSAVESIEVGYPSAEVSVFGFGVHWLVWFCIVSLVAMLALRKRMRVTF